MTEQLRYYAPDMLAPDMLLALCHHASTHDLSESAISDLLDTDCVAEMRRRHPNMGYLEVPNVGHAPMLDEDGVVPAIVDFLNR